MLRTFVSQVRNYSKGKKGGGKFAKPADSSDSVESTFDISKAKVSMSSALEKLKKEISTIRVGRANPGKILQKRPLVC
jgi:hypothetical protein